MTVIALDAFLVSPTEPMAMRRLGVTSGVPERHGCDVVWPAAGGALAGVQRKSLTDLWASLRDGRLAREATAMLQLELKVIVVEGRVRWSASGTLATGRGPFTKQQLRGLVLSLQRRGIHVLHTDDVDDTVAAIADVRRWHDKPTHAALDLRPPSPAPPGTRSWGIHLLQSFPGIGPTVAGNVVDHFGGVPLAWTCDRRELAAVNGVGPKRAASMLAALEPQPQCERTPSLPA